MQTLITKVSDDFYCDFKNFFTFEDLCQFVEKEGKIIFRKNHLYNKSQLRELYEDFTDEDWNKMITSKYEIKIYDDYFE